MDHGLTVVDLFCGGGGFSEGFRQAGFEVTHAVDLDAGARETYELNAPESTEVLGMDLTDPDPSVFPDDVDILIGSPPCKEFSSSKKGGGGDIDKGMILVDSFLSLVHELDPDYWVMENVPRLKKHLGETHETSEGYTVDVPRREILSCDQYGTPQRRKRVFSGNFPDPVEGDEPPMEGNESPPTFDRVRELFPCPTARWGDLTFVEDPLYEGSTLNQGELSDHFYNSHLTEREVKEIRVRKEDHSFYGPMSFPDDPDDTSRTVVAMNRRIARETLVMEEDTPPASDPSLTRFRKPTLRELATIQGFPITYQFTGSSLSKKRRRVGDAVPPTMAYRLALGILREEEVDISEAEPIVSPTPADHLAFDLSDPESTTRKRRKLSLGRSFRHHIPYDEMREFRVDLETNDERPRHPISSALDHEVTHPVGFQVVLYRGYAKTVESERITFDRALGFLGAYEEQYSEDEERVRNFLRALRTGLDDMVPDATTLQAIRSRRADRNGPLEFEILETIGSREGSEKSGIVDRYFPREQYIDADLEIGVDILDGTDLPPRVLMKLVGACYVAEKLNHCGRWVANHPHQVFLPDEWGITADDVPADLACERDCVEGRIDRLAEFGFEQDFVQRPTGHAD